MQDLRREAGFSLIELVTVCALIAILAALTIPIGVSYLRAATTVQGARDLQSRLNQARMLAVSSRQPVCVQFTPAGYKFRKSSCVGPVMANGAIGPNGIAGYSEPVTIAGGSPIFTQFGNATQATVLTVTGPAGSTATVTVSLSGRVTIP